jgi:anthranilate/para-aminobenzoate synthase component II
MVFKATVVLVVGGLTGSSLVALKSSLDESQPTAIARQEIAITPGSNSPDETNQLEYIQARFAAQRPFAALCSVSR